MIRNIHLQGIMCKMLIFRGVFFRIRWLKPLNCPFCFRSTAIAICASVGRNSLARSNCRPEMRKIPIKPAIWVGFIHLFTENTWQYGDNDYTVLQEIFKMMTLFKKEKPSNKSNVVRYEAFFSHYFTMFFSWPLFWPMGFLRWSLLFFGAKPKKQKLVSILIWTTVADVHMSMYTLYFYMCIYDVSQVKIVKGGKFGFQWLFNVGEDEWDDEVRWLCEKLTLIMVRKANSCTPRQEGTLILVPAMYYIP